VALLAGMICLALVFYRALRSGFGFFASAFRA